MMYTTGMASEAWYIRTKFQEDCDRNLRSYKVLRMGEICDVCRFMWHDVLRKFNEIRYRRWRYSQSQDQGQSQSYLTADGWSVGRSVGRYVLVSTPFRDFWPNIASCSKVAVWNLLSFICGAPSLTRGQVCLL
jgi:hypothetical protein